LILFEIPFAGEFEESESFDKVIGDYEELTWGKTHGST